MPSECERSSAELLGQRNDDALGVAASSEGNAIDCGCQAYRSLETPTSGPKETPRQ